MKKGRNLNLFLMVAASVYAALGAANDVSPEPSRDPETATADSPSLTSCRVEGIAQLARCGVFEIPENPDRPDGRRLPIHVVVIPATGGSSLKDPIVPLNGGPGEATISTAADYAERFATLLRDRDLVLI